MIRIVHHCSVESDKTNNPFGRQELLDKWAEEWIEVTTKLKNSGVNLRRIALVKND